MRISKRTWGIILLVLAVVAVIAVVVAVAVTTTGSDSEETVDPAAPSQNDEDAEGNGPAVATGEGSVTADALGREVSEVDSVVGEPVPQRAEPGGFPSGGGEVGPPAGLALQRVANGPTVMVSESDGPTGTQGDVLTGYARSAEGAALLLADYLGRSQLSNSTFADFSEFYASAELVNENVLDEMRRADSSEAEAHVRAGYTAPRWFKFSSCDPDFCTVSAAIPSLAETVGPDVDSNIDPELHLVGQMSVRWDDDQWRIVSFQPSQTVEIDSSWEQWL